MSAGGKNVLLVDDDEIQLVLRAQILEGAGFTPVSATTAAQALEFLRSVPAGAFDLVVTDHLLDDTLGTDLVRTIRSEQPRLPIIVVSGLPGLEQEYAGLDVHFQAKPGTPAEFLALVRDVTQRTD